MERIELATPEGSVDAVLASPDGRGPWPGVVVVHDMVSATSGGLPGIIERVGDAGHLVIAPNLYSRGGPIRCVTRVVRELRSLSGRVSTTCTRAAIGSLPTHGATARSAF